MNYKMEIELINLKLDKLNERIDDVMIRLSEEIAKIYLGGKK